MSVARARIRMNEAVALAAVATDQVITTNRQIKRTLKKVCSILWFRAARTSINARIFNPSPRFDLVEILIQAIGPYNTPGGPSMLPPIQSVQLSSAADDAPLKYSLRKR